MNKPVTYCSKCISFDLEVRRYDSRYDILHCNNCGFDETLLNKEQAIDMMKRINERKEVVNSFKIEGIMQATLRYDSIVVCDSMTLGILRDAVNEAIEKGMPLNSEVFNSVSEEAIEGVRFLYDTDKIEKCECGDHIPPTQKFDLLIATHECGVDDEANAN